MWPILYKNIEHGVVVYTWGVALVLAFSLAFLFVNGRASRQGLNPDKMIASSIAAAVGGIIGARVFTALTFELEQTLADPGRLFTLNGLTYYGGVLGGMVAVLISARIQGFLGWKFLDLLAPALVIGHTVGRIGCFFAGCCHGVPVQLSSDAIPLPLGNTLQGTIWLDSWFPFITTEFHTGVGRFLNQALYPTQLWSVLGGIFLVWFLINTLDRKRFDGQVTALMFIFEPMLRFAIEGFRGDIRGVVVNIPVGRTISNWFPGLLNANQASDFGLTTSQVIGMILIAVGIAIWVSRRGSGIASHRR
jgi:phosphatidylglycerol:prolipoprotein diacylglycerol transferase